MWPGFVHADLTVRRDFSAVRTERVHADDISRVGYCDIIRDTRTQNLYTSTAFINDPFLPFSEVARYRVPVTG